jgi:hypothetical protein
MQIILQLMIKKCHKRTITSNEIQATHNLNNDSKDTIVNSGVKSAIPNDLEEYIQGSITK